MLKGWTPILKISRYSPIVKHPTVSDPLFTEILKVIQLTYKNFFLNSR